MQAETDNKEFTDCRTIKINKGNGLTRFSKMTMLGTTLGRIPKISNIFHALSQIFHLILHGFSG